MKNKNFESIFKISKILYKIVGAEYLSDGKNTFYNHIRNNWLYYFNTLWIYTDVFGEFAWIFNSNRVINFLDLSFTMPLILYVILGSSRTSCIIYYGRKLKNLYDELEKIHPIENGNEKTNENYNVDEICDENEKRFQKTITTGETKVLNKKNKTNINKVKKNKIVSFNLDTKKKLEQKTKEIATEYIQFIHLVIKGLLYAHSITFFAFAFSPLIVTGFIYFTTGNIELKLPYIVIYPFMDLNEYKYYILAYIHQIHSTSIAVINVFGPDTVVIIFCTLISMHLAIIGEKFKEIIHANRFGNIDEGTLDTNFKELVEYHLTLIRCVDTLNEALSLSVLYNFSTTSIVICLTGFNVMAQSTLSQALPHLTLLMTNLWDTLMACYFGDMIMKSSAMVSEGVYNSKWYEMSKKHRKNILFILHRTQKPCQMTGGKFSVVNLSAFATILSTAYSYFALLRTMYKS